MQLFCIFKTSILGLISYWYQKAVLTSILLSTLRRSFESSPAIYFSPFEEKLSIFFLLLKSLKVLQTSLPVSLATSASTSEKAPQVSTDLLLHSIFQKKHGLFEQSKHSIENVLYNISMCLFSQSGSFI